MINKIEKEKIRIKFYPEFNEILKNMNNVLDVIDSDLEDVLDKIRTNKAGPKADPHQFLLASQKAFSTNNPNKLS